MNQDDIISQETNLENIRNFPHPSGLLIKILAFLGSIALILGLFTTLSVIIISIPYSGIIHPHGFLIGIFLILGGLILLFSLIIVSNTARPHENQPLAP
ncbi:hypothetical protein [Candidatus Hodarchaeum mangrovi]